MKIQHLKIFESFKESYIINENNKFRTLIPQSVIDLATEFDKQEKQLYVVGGAVRDFLMKKKPKDFDLATNAKPEETVKIAEKLGFKTLEVGRQFGIVVVVDNNGEELEIATFRIDKSGGRRPDAVEFTTIEGDVKRRDLTINALFYDIEKGEIVDLVGGEYDIKTGTIKTVGDPGERFDEDPLRKIRAIRFYARSGKQFDKQTEESLRADTSLTGVSGERIYDEFNKGLHQAAKPRVFVETLYDMGYLEYFFPNLMLYTRDFVNSKNPIIHASWILQNEDIRKIEKELNKAKWGKKEITYIKWLVKSKDVDFNYTYDLIRKRDQLELDFDIVKEWSILFPKQKEWINRLMTFDLNNINTEEVLSGVKPSDRTKVMIDKIRELW